MRTAGVDPEKTHDQKPVVGCPGAGASLSACGGKDSTVVINCDEDLQYQNREVGKRVVAPEGMDQLDEFAEMPIPKADPEAASRLPEGRCADHATDRL